MKATVLKLSIAIMFFAFTKCDKDNNNSKPLNINELKTSWELERVIEKQTGKIDTLYSPYLISLIFHSENCVSIIGPCKSGPGKFEINGNNVIISIISLSDPDAEYYEKYCNSEYYNSSDFDEIFFNNLNGNYHINGNKMTINSDGDYNLEFSKTSSNYSFACFDEGPELLIDSIPENKYYDTEIFENEDTIIYGKWLNLKTYGGLQGNSKPGFTYFEAKKSGTFGIIKDDSIFSYGKINILEKTNNHLLIFLEADTNFNYLVGTWRWKYVEFYGEKIMVLRDECTDCFWHHFIRKE